MEAEIADCCRALYWATEPDVALDSWTRLRRLRAEKAEAERRQFLQEATRRQWEPLGR